MQVRNYMQAIYWDIPAADKAERFYLAGAAAERRESREMSVAATVG